jgi:DNA-binding XRE family transcriptional regulator
MWWMTIAQSNKKGGEPEMTESIRISLKAARINSGLTVDAVSKEINVSKATIVNWEKGNTLPDADKAIALSELYKLPLENLNFCKKS